MYVAPIIQKSKKNTNKMAYHYPNTLKKIPIPTLPSHFRPIALLCIVNNTKTSLKLDTLLICCEPNHKLSN